VAVEKGGIIKPSVPVVIGRQFAEVDAILEKISVARGSRAVRFDRDYALVSRPGRVLDFRGSRFKLDAIELSLEGAHQHDNAALALATVEELCERGILIGESAIRRGLSSVFWPGRFEIISASPDIILDGAHNPAGVGALTETVERRYPGKKGVVIAGFMADKDIAGMLERLALVADVIIFTNPGGERGFDPQGEMGYKDKLKKETEVLVLPDIESALSEAKALIGEGPFILVTGSLLLIGEVRKRLIDEL
jgi:dihydrofolate synthase/folylpolyglutamate synthase